MYSPLMTFNGLRRQLIWALVHEAQYEDVGEWQSIDVSNKPEMVTKELRHVNYALSVPANQYDWALQVTPNLPWAEDHFQERVSGIPHNPPPSEAWWPFAQRGNADHKADEIFSHTYPERMWPKKVGSLYEEQNVGLRYNLGDLDDVVGLLVQSPMTRQAYLPIWFPEDTGNVQAVRVPCSIGYHFLMRRGRMDVTYTLRSCDFLRHWADDVYMAGRLLQWVVRKLQANGIDVTTGSLIMQISSLHVFRGDEQRMNLLHSESEAHASANLLNAF